MCCKDTLFFRFRHTFLRSREAFLRGSRSKCVTSFLHPSVYGVKKMK